MLLHFYFNSFFRYYFRVQILNHNKIVQIGCSVWHVSNFYISCIIIVQLVAGNCTLLFWTIYWNKYIICFHKLVSILFWSIVFYLELRRGEKNFPLLFARVSFVNFREVTVEILPSFGTVVSLGRLSRKTSKKFVC